MADPYPTLHRVHELLDVIETRHGVIDALHHEAAELALAEGAALVDVDLAVDTDDHG